MKESYIIPFESSSSILQVRYSNPIQLDSRKSYKVGITGGYLPVAWPNITSTNNTLKIGYVVDEVTTWDDVTIPEGQYSVDDIGAFLETTQRNLYDSSTRHYVIAGDSTADKSDDVVGIKLSYDYSSMKTNIYMYPNYKIDLGKLGTILGWADDTVITTTNVNVPSTNIPSIEGTYKYYNILCDLVKPQPMPNGKSNANLLYSNTPAVGAGSIQPLPQMNFVTWAPFDQSKAGSLMEATCKVTDQNGSPLNLRGQNIVIVVTIEEN